MAFIKATIDQLTKVFDNNAVLTGLSVRGTIQDTVLGTHSFVFNITPQDVPKLPQLISNELALFSQAVASAPPRPVVLSTPADITTAIGADTITVLPPPTV